MRQNTFEKIITSFLFGALFLFMTIVFYSCKSEESAVTDPGGGNGSNTKALISGQVLDQATGFPVDSALVRVFGNNLNTILYTAVDGQFAVEGEVDLNEDLLVLTYKQSYKLDSTIVIVTDVKQVSVPQIRLKEVVTGGGGGSVSGDPVSIFLASITSTVIGVKESGSVETTRITFVVQDSAGVPVDEDHSVVVNFLIGAGPGGGEFLSPYSVETNSAGLAAVNLTSGTKAGTVQIIATINFLSNVINSQPVGVTIHGGLPDLVHFSIAPQSLNFAGYNIFGLTDQITAFVGDKYANPVRPETAVYFTTTGGIIQGSTLTNESGIGSVDLISAEPRPIHPTLGAGFATITASTIDENSTTIFTETIVLFSGVPQVSITPTSFNIPNGGSQAFSYYVGDQNGNPLTSGTNISVAVQGESVEAQGDLSLQLPDTQSPAWTQFSFVVFDKEDTVNVAKPVTIRLSTDGPNGGAFLTIGGISN
ncbi:MAG: Ig-like domain-containing protein [Ignavibacteriaceae bacterium]